MKILIDECLPRYLKRALANHEVYTVQDKSWGGVKNGALLKLAEAEFSVFITADQNLQYQQNLINREIIMIVLPTNTLSILKLLISEIIGALLTAKRGDFIEIKMK